MWFVILSFFAAIYLFLFNRNDRKLRGRDVPMPPTLPLLGNALDFYGLGAEGTMQKLFELRQRYGSVFRVKLGSQICTFVANPEDLEAVLNHPKLMRKSVGVYFARDWLGDGLILSTGQKWFARRKAITPAFHFSILDNFVDVFDRNAQTLMRKLDAVGAGKSFDVTRFVTLYTLDVICEAAMGTKVNALENAESDYVKATEEISKIIFERLFNSLQHFELFWRLTPAKRRHDKLLKVLHGFTNSVIKARRKELIIKGDETQEEQHGDPAYGKKRRYALLDLLLKSKINGNPLSNEDIREEVDDFMFGGHDTTTSAISFLIYNLARHPKIQQKVYEEIVEVLGTDSREPVTMPKLNSLKYLDLVFKESLRIHTPVPTLGRQADEEVMVNDLCLPAKSTIAVCINMMAMDPKYFPKPNTFNPERFAGERSAEEVNPFTYIPFSAGPRNCIGQKFAQLEVKTMISKLLQNFEVTLGYEGFVPILRAEIVLKSGNGIQIKLTPRKKMNK